MIPCLLAGKRGIANCQKAEAYALTWYISVMIYPEEAANSMKQQEIQLESFASHLPQKSPTPANPERKDKCEKMRSKATQFHHQLHITV